VVSLSNHKRVSRGYILATELKMPQMGYDMQEGTVVRWLKSEGASVSVGEPIAEIETDKAVVEFESYASGVLRRVLVLEGATVPVGEPIAIVGEAGEEPTDVETQTPVAAAEPKATVEAPAPVASSIPLPASAAEAAQPRAGDVRASPVARRLAQERGADLSRIEGTGPGGRITKDDVLAFAPGPVVPAPEPVAQAIQPESEAATATTEGRFPLSRMRQQIARVTAKSKQEKPHFYVSSEIDMTRTMEFRVQINEALQAQGVRVSVNDLLIKACVEALKAYPKFNAFFSDDGMQMNDGINIGVAIAQEEGLIVPAIMDCADKSLAEIAVASKDLVERSNSGTLHPQEYTGGTFAISNLGMFDVTSFLAIIQPPQTAVLAVGTVAKRPAVRDDQVVVAQTMIATLSADHRIVDGAEGAQFLVEVKRLLENPVGFFL